MKIDSSQFLHYEALQEVKAKETETLIEHTLNAVNQWFLIKERYEKVFPFSEEFWQQSFISVLFHDMGKATYNFQDLTIKGLWKYKGSLLDDDRIRHEFVSGLVLLGIQPLYYQQYPEPLVAVFAHHKKWNHEIFLNYKNRPLKLIPEALKAFVTFAEQVYEQAWKEKRAFSSKGIDYLNTQNHDFLFENIFKAKFVKNIKANEASRKTYIFYKSILHLADWTSSAHKPLPTLLPALLQEALQAKIVTKLENEGKTEIAAHFQFRKFQEASITEKNVLAIAPTGSGKTEASLLWASLKKPPQKIIYLLPTRVTANALWKRLCGYFGEEHTAIVHSSALLMRELAEDKPYKDYLYDACFFKPVTVATIDQLLTQGFNLGHWDLKTFHCFEAKIIIDEVHLYSPWTLGLIIATIQYLQKEWNATFYLMTATMPLKLKQLLTNTLSVEQTIFVEDSELLDSARNTFFATEKAIDEMQPQIVEALQQNKKVLIVVNTVDEAIRLYKAYQDFSPICYHSRFIVRDRQAKETQIFEREKDDSKGCLLIATQVVEVSLDIDYDILFTENAPIDALIQRAGRVNRKRNANRNTEVWVFPHRDVVKEYVYSLEKVLENTFEMIQQHHGQRLTERILLEMVNQVYENIEVTENAFYKEAINQYSKIQKEEGYIKDVSLKDRNNDIYTREGMDSISVIPCQFYEEIQTKKLSAAQKKEYEVSIRKWQYAQRKCSLKDDDGFEYVDIAYSSETGLDFKGTPPSKTNIIC
ncbi:MAG: CRISPR-associated helicase Cas3' [Bacteroidia bacterium]